MNANSKLSKNEEFFLNKILSIIPKDVPIKISSSVEGMRVDDKKITLGYRVGNSYELSALLHELGHLIDIDNNRVFRNGWGLWISEIEIMGKYYIEPRTTKASERECRAIAWQILLGKFIGFDMDVKNEVTSLRFMPDFYLIPVLNENILSSKESENDKINWLINRVEEHLSNWTVQDAIEELNKKFNYIKNFK